MRKYLMIKNGMLTLVVASIYYKSVFADISMLVRVFGTAAIFISLMWLLNEADRLFMEDIVQKKKKSTSGRDTMMRSGNQFN